MKSWAWRISTPDDLQVMTVFPHYLLLNLIWSSSHGRFRWNSGWRLSGGRSRRWVNLLSFGL